MSKLLLERPMSAADALGCLANTTDFEGTVLTATTNNHYDDTSDSPAWSQNPATVVNGVDTTSWKRMLTSLSGDAVINTSGTTTATGTTVSTATGNISDMHGDTIANIDLTPGTQSVSSTSAYDEYGAPIQTPDLTQPGKYGWIGTKSRLASLGGIVLMGVRLYNPTSGRFLQVDPIRGGNANAYSYPTDPILGFDLDGKFGWSTALDVAGIIAAIACGASVVCAIGIGAAVAGSQYLLDHHTNETFDSNDFARSLAVGVFEGAASRFMLGKYAMSKLNRKVYKVGKRSIRLHFDKKPHKFPKLGVHKERSHWQITHWKTGVRGSHVSRRFPVYKSFPLDL